MRHRLTFPDHLCIVCGGEMPYAPVDGVCSTSCLMRSMAGRLKDACCECGRHCTMRRRIEGGPSAIVCGECAPAWFTRNRPPLFKPLPTERKRPSWRDHVSLFVEPLGLFGIGAIVPALFFTEWWFAIGAAALVLSVACQAIAKGGRS